MSVEAEQLLTRARPKNALGRVLQFPLVRAVIVLVFLAPFLALHNTVVGDFLASLREPLKSYIGYLDTVVSVLILILLYRLYTRWVERRDAVEMGTHGLLLELGAGFLVALAVVGFMVFAMGALGYAITWYPAAGWANAGTWMVILLMIAGTAVVLRAISTAESTT